MNISHHTNNFLKQYFDKVLVVTIPRLTMRHQAIQQNLLGLDFEFFYGADKMEIDFEKAKTDGTYDEASAKKLQRQGKALNHGELACSLTHRLVYAAMIKNSWKRVLILEDDAIPLLATINQLPETLQELPANWELVYLGYLKHEKVTMGLKVKQFLYKIASALGIMTWSYKMVSNLLPKPYSKHLRKAGFHDCTHAYAVTQQAAAKLLNAQTPVVYRADDLLSSTIMKGELNAFVTEPKFFDQEIFRNASISSEIKEG
ncbi:MAG: glycosyltransferase family 25 protein [Ferruginibacter sp.]|nr:glycosyltransferase family 25 protein [Bacteroidota bacterium]MBX2918049.1 glycosyltransferase family 25 protein [Ferruginibacter sp.]MCB0708471.1 glycosyltransferase family 25 protein [Chitinophagaceae bacterium]MCC7379574.1 glycosyltransferase family 25 protein [Chitinophagaceae bacterium]